MALGNELFSPSDVEVTKAKRILEAALICSQQSMPLPAMRALGAQVILANAYHLYLQPGADIVDEAGLSGSSIVLSDLPPGRDQWRVGTTTHSAEEIDTEWSQFESFALDE